MSLLPVFIPVLDSTRIAQVRRVAVGAAEAEGLGWQASEEVAIISTEIATNLLRHAVSGEVQITRLSATGEPGVEILSIDRGPGMANVEACATDGFSTAGSAGNGLGAITRLADVFDVYSQRGRGTVLVARKFLKGRTGEPRERWTPGAVRVSCPGEEVCGDDWTLRRQPSTTSLIVADGLGHGILAAGASSSAIEAFEKGRGDAPASLLAEVHLSLRATRGAAVAIARINQDNLSVSYAGVGNIAGVVLSEGRPRFMLSHNGTAGYEARHFQEFDYPLPADAAIVMHSDGLTSSWSLDAYPGLMRRHPAVIAGILYRDANRGRDDICVLVARYIRE